MALILVLAVIPLIGAQSYGYSSNFIYDNVAKAIDIVTQTATPFFEIILGQGQTSQFFLAKIMLLIIVFIIAYFALRFVPLFDSDDKKWAAILVAAVVSILAIRYIPENDFINGIILPYTTLGIAITTLLPFIIYFFFVENAVPGTFGRRVAWAVYGVIFGVMWYMRQGDLASGNTIYAIGAALILLAFIFDKTIHGYFGLVKVQKAERNINDEHIVKLLNLYSDAKKSYEQTGNEAAERRMKFLKERLKEAAVNVD